MPHLLLLGTIYTPMEMTSIQIGELLTVIITALNNSNPSNNGLCMTLNSFVLKESSFLSHSSILMTPQSTNLTDRTIVNVEENLTNIDPSNKHASINILINSLTMK